MPRHDLSGLWQAWTDPSRGEDFFRPQFDHAPEHLLEVPGHWQEEPSLSKHEGSVFYRTVFNWQPTLTWPVARLCLGAAFYQIKVWLNGHPLAEHDCYFTPLVQELPQDILQSGENVLAIRVDCPPPGMLWRDIIMGAYAEGAVASPGLNPGGLWGEVVLEETFRGFLQKLRIDSHLSGWNVAHINLQSELVWRSIPGRAKAVATIRPRNFVGKEISQEFPVSVQAGNNPLQFKLNVPEPKLWWTWDQGFPHLYDVELALFDAQGGKVDSLAGILGVRDLKWEHNHLHINGRRLFLRGVNYGPPSIFPLHATEDRLRQDVRLIKDANFNFVRLWGHVAPRQFYTYCAEAGLALWQDFPLNGRYGRNVTGTALLQIRSLVSSLYNEPAICFWCCHSEPHLTMGTGWHRGVGAVLGKFVRSVKPGWNKDIFDPRLQEAAAQIDDSRPILAHTGVPRFIGGKSISHLYYGWRGRHYRFLARIARFFPGIMRFVNEYGAQSLPTDEEFLRELESYGRWPHLNWDNITVNYRAETDALHHYTPPEAHNDLAEYARATQAYQGELLQFYHEFLRRHKFRPCGGATMFHFADPRPLISSSLLDAKRQPKLAYAVTQRAMQPLLPMIKWPPRTLKAGANWRTPVFIVNDFAQGWPMLGLTWQLLAAEEVCSRERRAVSIGANTVEEATLLELAIPDGIRGECLLELILTLPSGEAYSNKYKIKIKM